MLPSADADLMEIRRIVLRKLSPAGAQVYLFGSYATGRALPSSDVDVALLSSTPLPAGLLAEVREDLENSLVPLRVDLVDLSETDESFRARVLREGIPWAA